MQETPTVTAADIARLAGVGRAAVSNWRKRHADFPAPVGGTAASPEFALGDVEGWLRDQGKLPEVSTEDRLWSHLSAASDHLAATVGEVGAYLLSRKRGESPSLPDVDATVRQAVADLVDRQGPQATFDELWRRFIDREARRIGATPDELADLMVGLADVAGGSVLDPACGTGGVLRAAVRAGCSAAYGQEIDEHTGRLIALWLAMRDVPGDIHVGDSLRADAFGDLTVDAVVSNPPFGDTNWGQEELGYDPRWEYGTPPRTEPELAWVQHSLAHLRPGGTAVILMPPSAASRRAGRRIRTELLRGGALRAVIALPARAAAPHGVPLHLWVLRRPAPDASPPAQVLLADGTDGDLGAVCARVLKAYRAFTETPESPAEEPGFARAVPVIELLDEEVDLSPARHVRTAPAAAKPEQQVATASALRSRMRQAVADLTALSDGESWPPAGAEPRSWRSATVADLLRGGALTLQRVAAAGRGTTSDRAENEAPIRTLTAQDVAASRSASGAGDERAPGEGIEIREGDVILPEVLHGGARAARVADARDAGQLLGRNLFLLRPDPERLDPWFLAGFLAAEDNLNAAATGTSVVRLDVRRLRVPLLPLHEQRRYGTAFRQLQALRAAADLTSRLAEETVRALGSGLTGGALLPPDVDPAGS
ncbi:N-6 DNA methylase [Planosporangium mesophilum]|uniref:Type II restriction endonuclease subunit M n=1 Tax=Planosporangium mesophilum TaxID=689768 RepID=A0A8J3TA50_9ACTN|nr:N-6 DNA methylase [Planosporangium mesophilum]GII22718.1 type II restriction endonuclease subunit M [Planosporangium mesophilum]